MPNIKTTGRPISRPDNGSDNSAIDASFLAMPTYTRPKREMPDVAALPLGSNRAYLCGRWISPCTSYWRADKLRGGRKPWSARSPVRLLEKRGEGPEGQRVSEFCKDIRAAADTGRLQPLPTQTFCFPTTTQQGVSASIVYQVWLWQPQRHKSCGYSTNYKGSRTPPKRRKILAKTKPRSLWRLIICSKSVS